MANGTAFSKMGADLLGNRRFESISLQRRVSCEPEFSGKHPTGDRRPRQLKWSTRRAPACRCFRASNIQPSAVRTASVDGSKPSWIYPASVATLLTGSFHQYGLAPPPAAADGPTPISSQSLLKRPLNLSGQPFASGDHLTEVLCEPELSGFRQEFPVTIGRCAIVLGRLLLPGRDPDRESDIDPYR
jgi:hypothetical protein